jgi:hypothetical protein
MMKEMWEQGKGKGMGGRTCGCAIVRLQLRTWLHEGQGSRCLVAGCVSASQKPTTCAPICARALAPPQHRGTLLPPLTNVLAGNTGRQDAAALMSLEGALQA